MDAGVFLTGGGAFIELDAGPFIDLAGSVAAWAEAMAVRRPEAEYAAASRPTSAAGAAARTSAGASISTAP